MNRAHVVVSAHVDEQQGSFLHVPDHEGLNFVDVLCFRTGFVVGFNDLTHCEVRIMLVHGV